jgi:hypothetical protein
LVITHWQIPQAGCDGVLDERLEQKAKTVG